MTDTTASLPAAAPAPPSSSTPLTLQKLMFLIVGLSGSFLVTLTAQFATTNIADLQGTIASTPDEASWIATAYTMASFAGIVCSGPLSRTFGLGPYVFGNAIVFCVTAILCAASPPLDSFIVLRTVQGLAAGCFGPVAFISVFTIMGGQRLPLGLVLLAFVLVFPTTIGPIISGYLEDDFGWQPLFAVQAVVGVLLAAGALFFLPWLPPKWASLKTDWVAVALLIASLALIVLVLNQGTRRFWFDNEMIVWCTIGCIASFAGFVYLCAFSPMPIISPGLFITRNFGVPIVLNLVFRGGFAVSTYLIPQFLAIVQGYRPLEIAHLLLWGAFAQALTLPVAWWLLHKIDARGVMALGLILCGIGTALVINSTILFAADQFKVTIVVFSVGQLLFLAPDVLIGAVNVKPADTPTASLAFNMGTLGGVTLGVGLVSNFVTEREKFHSNVLTENISLYDFLDSTRIAALATKFGDRFTDDAVANAKAVSVVAAGAQRQAWVLSFNDGFLLVAGILVASAIGTLIIGSSPALKRPTPTSDGAKAS